MADNPYAKSVKKAEKDYSTKLDKLLTNALRAKAVQKKADAKASKSGRTPSRDVVKIFESALNVAIKKLPSEYSGLKIVPKTTYEQKGTQWFATVSAKATFIMTDVGGGTYTTKPGDNLWDISKNYYGEGRYWLAITAANPWLVKSKESFILAGEGLEIPKIKIPAGICEIDAYTKTAKPEKAAQKKARPVMFPTLSYDMSQTKSVKTTHKLPGATVIITTSLTGKLKGQKAGLLPASFNLRSYETEMKKGVGPFTNSIKINKLKADSISISSSVSGTKWDSGFSLSAKGTFKVSLAPKPISFKVKGIVFQGNVGMSVEVQIIPLEHPKSVPVSELALEWLKDNASVMVGIALLATAATVVQAIVVEEVLVIGALQAVTFLLGMKLMRR